MFFGQFSVEYRVKFGVTCTSYFSYLFPSWKSSDPKILGIKTFLFENFSPKKGSRKFYVTFLG